MEENFPVDSNEPVSHDTISALVTALGAVVAACVRQLDAAQQADFAVCLATAARVQTSAGDTIGAMFLQDLHRIASMSATR